MFVSRRTIRFNDTNVEVYTLTTVKQSQIERTEQVTKQPIFEKEKEDNPTPRTIVRALFDRHGPPNIQYQEATSERKMARLRDDGYQTSPKGGENTEVSRPAERRSYFHHPIVS